MEWQLRDTCLSASKVSLDASTWGHLEDFWLEYEKKIQAAQEVLHLLIRVRAEGSDEPARVFLPGTVRGFTPLAEDGLVSGSPQRGQRKLQKEKRGSPQRGQRKLQVSAGAAVQSGSGEERVVLRGQACSVG